MINKLKRNTTSNFRRESCIFIFFLFLFFQGYTQQEFSNWYFGQRAGLNFNDSPNSPRAIFNGEIEANQGCSTISTEEGNLLFYTNGEEIWDRRHNVLPNGTGLLGSTVSNQSSFIVPKPQDPNIYYVFTTDATINLPPFSGFRYSEIDLRLNNGFGDITDKNILLNSDSAENLTVVQHENNIDFWVIIHGAGDNSFYAYLVTENGIASTPIISMAGRPYSFSSGGGLGAIKVSANGNRLALISPDFGEESFIEVFDFDSATGVILNNTIRAEGVYTFNANIGFPISLEFSPNSEYLYVSSFNGLAVDGIPQPNSIFRFNARAGSSAEFRSSLVRLYLNPARIGDIQRGIDDKLYISAFEEEFIGSIENPDELDADYNEQGISLVTAENPGRRALVGLPQLIADFFYLKIGTERFCFGQLTTFFIDTGDEVQSVLWDFGDNTGSSELMPTHKYSAPGTYTVRAEVTIDGQVFIIEEDMLLPRIPIANPIDDIYVCDDESNDGIARFDLGSLNERILDNNIFSQNVSYYASEEDALARVNILEPMFLILEGSQRIFARVQSNTNSDCFDITSFDLIITDSPNLVLEDTYLLCLGGSVQIDGGSFDTYLWSTGETSQSINIRTAGDYSLTVGNRITTTSSEEILCTSTRNFTVIASDIPEVIDLEIIDLSSNNSITVFAEGAGDYEYSIDGVNYQDNPTFNNLVDARYTVFVRDKNGCGIAGKEAFLLTAPSFFTPNNDGINDLWMITSASEATDLEVFIFDRYGKLLANLTENSAGWNGKHNGIDLPSSDYWFLINRGDNNQSSTGHFTLKR